MDTNIIHRINDHFMQIARDICWCVYCDKMKEKERKREK